MTFYTSQAVKPSLGCHKLLCLSESRCLLCRYTERNLFSVKFSGIILWTICVTCVTHIFSQCFRRSRHITVPQFSQNQFNSTSPRCCRPHDVNVRRANFAHDKCWSNKDLSQPIGASASNVRSIRMESNVIYGFIKFLPMWSYFLDACFAVQIPETNRTIMALKKQKCIVNYYTLY